MKVKIIFSLFLSMYFSSISGFVSAESSNVGVSGNIAVTSDYIWRGTTQTDNNPAIQGGYDLEYKSGYLGLWGSNVLAGSEFDLYAGYKFDISNFGINFGAIRYIFPHFTDSDATEGVLGLSYSSALEIGTIFYHDLERENNPLTAELTVGYKVLSVMDLSGTYGVNGSNKYYHAGISKDLINLNFGFILGAATPDQGDSETNLAFIVTKTM